jgi:hypothetical protein
LQKCAVKDKGADLVPWIQIGRLGLGVAVDRYTAGLTGGVARARPLDEDPTILELRKRAAAASSRRRGKARRRAAASGGANPIRHWGVPIAAGSAPRRRARAREPTGDPHGRRRRRTTAPGEAWRRRTAGDGEGGGAAHGTQISCTGGPLTLRRNAATAPIRWRGGDGAGRRRGPRQRRRRRGR